MWIVFASAILTLFFDYPFSNLKKLIFDSNRKATVEKVEVDENSNEVEIKKKIKWEKKLASSNVFNYVLTGNKVHLLFQVTNQSIFNTFT